MGRLRYKYYCNKCYKTKYSYFSGMGKCQNCGSEDIVEEDIRDLNIEKFSDEGEIMIIEG